jgi:hypothetical protein
VAREAEMRQRLANGELGAEIYGFHELANQLGIEDLGDMPPT